MNAAYEAVTNHIIALLERGTIPWRMPWKKVALPQNLVSRKRYRGINVFLLACQRYSSAYWLSFKQVQDLGGRVNYGAKSSPVVFWKWLEIKDPDENEPERVPFLRFFRVFNLLQTSGIEAPEDENGGFQDIEPIPDAEAVISNMPNRPKITHDHDRAYYDPKLDIVNVPPMGMFDGPEEAYATTFHELAHSTGHKTRLNRKMDTENRQGEDCMEELVAEFTATYLCGHCAIEGMTIDNSVAYISNWMEKLKNDKRMVVIAAAQAQKAADYILGRLAGHTADDKEPLPF